MKVICAVLAVYFWTEINGQMSENSSKKTLTSEVGLANKTFLRTTYNYDPQVPGFNSTKLKSGPIVLADKRTIFISNLQYQGEDVLIFYAGTGGPYNDEKQIVAEEYFTGNHINLYIKLPENLTLDVINFFGSWKKNSSDLLDYVIFEKINRSTIRDYQEENTKDTIYRIPKCCHHHEYLIFKETARGCDQAQEEINLDIKIFESNVTGLDPEVRLNASEFELRPYYQGLLCNDNEVRVGLGDELYGLIYNSSLIIQGSGILSHGEYCVEIVEDKKSDKIYTTTALYCYPIPLDTSDPNLYLPVLIVSTISFALSAAAYGIILKVQDVYKICFIAYSLSMCLTFLSLIILQVQSNGTTCNIFGFMFLFSAILSFLWLLIVCLELLYLVRTPLEDKRNDNRWHWYIEASLGVSALLCIISMFSGELWIPDVPNSFIKNYGNDKCEFNTSLDRAFIMFVPMILSIVLSIISLIFLRRLMKQNEKNIEIRSHIDWMENRNTYTFLSRTYVIIIVVASFWLFNLIFYSYQLGSAQLALDIIEASLGIVTLIGFVLNKYTLAEIKEKLFKKKKPITEEGLRLNGISTPETPATHLDDPFIEPLQMNSNLTTFGNNRNR